MAHIWNKSLAALAALLLLAAPASATTYLVSATGGSNANACTDWGTPCQTVAGALAKTTPTLVGVDNTGTFTAGTVIAWNFPSQAPLAIISSTNPGSGSTITPTAGATEAVGASNSGFTIECNAAGGAQAYIYGMHITGGTTGAGAGVSFLQNGRAGCDIQLDTVTVTLPSTSATNIAFGSTGATYVPYIRAVNSTFTLSANRTGAMFGLGNARIELVNPTISLTGSAAPSVLFQANNNATFWLTVSDGDISPFNVGGATFINSSGGGVPWDGTTLFKNLKISATPTLVGAFAFSDWYHGSITLRNVDSGNTLFKFQYQDPRGTLTVDTTNFESSTGGASFNGAGAAWKIVTTTLPSVEDPFCSPLIEQWNTNTGSQTLKVEFAQNSAAAALTDVQIWAQLDYPNSASFPSYTLASDRNASPILAAGSAQPTSTATWAGLTSPTTQYLANTFTALANGLLQAQVCVAAASTTLWINPNLTP